MVKHAGWIFGVEPFNFGQGGDQAFDLLRTVTYRNDGKKIADISEFDLYAVIIS